MPVLAAGAEDPDDSLHITSALADINLKRIQSSKPGGTWRDWDSDLVAACHRVKTGKTFPSVYESFVPPHDHKPAV
jgi:DNA (cytosine-5)-methyltransferase 1